MAGTTSRQRVGLGACIALAFAVASWPSLSKADSVTGTRSAELEEVSHDIEVTMDRGHASLVVHRTLFNGGPRHDQALVRINLPPGAVATGLKTLGMLGGSPHWFAGDLMEAEAAAAKYQELTGIGRYYPKDPALLYWWGQSELILQVFPCAPSANKSVAYTLLMPTNYFEGKYVLQLPWMGTAQLSAVVKVRAARMQDRLFVQGRPVQPNTQVPFPAGESPLEISLEPASPPPVSGALAVVSVAQDRNLIHARFESAPRLSEVPRSARLIALIDVSRSLTDSARQSAVAAARAWLTNFPDATAEVVAFDRAVHPYHRRLVPVAQAIKDLETTPVVAGNGSAVDLGLGEAARLLARTRGGEARVVVFTDTLTRSALSAAALKNHFARVGGTTHVAVMDANSQLLRDDSHAWSAHTRPTGGLVWHAGATGDPEQHRQETKLFEELARPVRLHHVRVQSSGLLSDELTSIDELPEGVGYSELTMSGASGTSFHVEGELWTRKVRSAFGVTPQDNRRWSALVFGSPLVDELSDEEMMVLAMQGGAVSPVTSYLAIEPGVRPSTEGLDRGGRGGGIGLGSIGTIGHGSGTGSGRSVAPFDYAAWWEHEIGTALRACGGTGSARVEVETTLQEIVDVLLVEADAPNDPRVGVCLREAVWKLEPPPEFNRLGRRSWKIG